MSLVPLIAEIGSDLTTATEVAQIGAEVEQSGDLSSSLRHAASRKFATEFAKAKRNRRSLAFGNSGEVLESGKRKGQSKIPFKKAKQLQPGGRKKFKKGKKSSRVDAGILAAAARIVAGKNRSKPLYLRNPFRFKHRRFRRRWPIRSAWSKYKQYRYRRWH
jgi:hypothetical protein